MGAEARAEFSSRAGAGAGAAAGASLGGRVPQQIPAEQVGGGRLCRRRFSHRRLRRLCSGSTWDLDTEDPRGSFLRSARFSLSHLIATGHHFLQLRNIRNHQRRLLPPATSDGADETGTSGVSGAASVGASGAAAVGDTATSGTNSGAGCGAGSGTGSGAISGAGADDSAAGVSAAELGDGAGGATSAPVAAGVRKSCWPIWITSVVSGPVAP